MKTQTVKVPSLLGAHTSASGGVWNALLQGADIGATTIQLFTANQRRWQTKPLEQESIERFKETKERTGLKQIMSHASYLLNLGSPDPNNLTKSRQAFQEEIVRCIALGISYLNFHPGAALSDTREACLDRIVESILENEELLSKGNLRLLIEMTAGQGSTVGVFFEEIAYLLERTKQRVPIGVCWDTCHLFAAGYDLRTEKACEATLAQFDKVVGLPHLFAFHFNDSLHELGLRKDRHAPLGEGRIGFTCFEYFMKASSTCDLPKYLETPGGPEVWKKEIMALKACLP